ncbi:MAG: class C sortase [Tissierellia bacterium]|nr:class C sortase [Tissierellia bacterium]
MRGWKPRTRMLVYAVVFLLGFVITIYPLVSRLYYRVESKGEIEAFEREKVELVDEEVLRRMELAKAYNETLDPSKIGDPYTRKHQEGIAEYARMLELREKIGHVEIPKIDEDIPIYAGTSEFVLQKGAGHLEGTSLPVGGESTHAVITAHRGLPTAKLFSDLNKLEVGDRFFIHNIQGVLAYQVDQILTVGPSDFDPVLVVDGYDYATLLTCTPYMINSHRLLVRGERIDYVPAVQEREIAVNREGNLYKYLFFGTLTLLVLLLLTLLIRRVRRKKKGHSR